jgi:hypothetical protein
MEPLDLSKGRPRATRAELAGITFLPRSIDKFRAALPGGNLAGYTIEGFTTTMLEKLGIVPAALQAIAENPWLAGHPEIKYSLDFLQYMEDHNLDD